MNPMLQKMSNPSFSLSNLAQIARGNPQGMFNQLMSQNPKFAQFVRSNQGKSADQIARENGIDINLVRSFMK